jgi:glycosyltransferase involved in cell wall biosynthesis
VSTWVHDLIGGLPELRFALVHIGPERRSQGPRRYPLLPNVVSLSDLYCREPLVGGCDTAAQARAARAARHRHASAGHSRVIRGFRLLLLEDRFDGSLLDDLATGDLSVGACLHGQECFELTMQLYERLAPDASFLDFFWNLRSMFLPLVRLLGAFPPPAATYHALCTGYAGLLAAVWSHRTGRPFLLTEHGIYARERNLELDRVAWVRDTGEGRHRNESHRGIDDATASALRTVWRRFFRALARCTYAQASTIVSLCEASRAKQLFDGAAADKTLIVPNGVDVERFQARVHTPAFGERRRVTVGFVGRVVPIKNIVTLIRACFLALRSVELDVRIFGPSEEDPRYAQRCRRLVAKLGLEHAIRFEPTSPIESICSQIDFLVLTSFSEGQPLVILEANAAGIPVIASDVGACRELLEGRGEADRRIGPSGIVTRLAAPEETAAAIARLARNPRLRRRMGAAGLRRVAAFYRKSTTIAAYRALYRAGSWQESAGVSSA